MFPHAGCFSLHCFLELKTMVRNKLKKMEELKTLPNAFETQEELGKGWYREFFANDRPVTLELACGWGEYTLALAQKFPRRNFVGIDIKGARLWKGAKWALQHNIRNAAFLRCYVDELPDYFFPGTVEEIWITFPDPHPKKNKANKRLTSLRYLEMYRPLLTHDGVLHLKTDNDILFDYSVVTLRECEAEIMRLVDDTKKVEDDELLAIKTKYEKRFEAEGIPIKYLCAKLE